MEKDFVTEAVPEPEVEILPPLKTLHPSMSNSERLLNCQWWPHREVAAQEPEEIMRYGVAFHNVMAALIPSPPRKIDIAETAAKWDVDYEELRLHVKDALQRLHAWLRSDNQWGIDFIKKASCRVETAVAYNVVKKTARSCIPPTEKEHRYVGIAETEFPGTSDLTIDEISVSKKSLPDLIVLDHKTGYDCDLPLESAQLKSLVTASAVRVKAKRPAGAIFHSPRDGSGGYIYADDFDKPVLKEHAANLKEAWQRIGKGHLRPGAWCVQCPAMTSCPVHTSALVELRPNGQAMTAERIGKMHLLKAQAEAFLTKVDKEVIRPWIKQNGPAIRPDGKILAFKTNEVERLSKKAFIEKLGAAEAEKRFEKLRKEGILKKEPEEKLLAMDDK